MPDSLPVHHEAALLQYALSPWDAAAGMATPGRHVLGRVLYGCLSAAVPAPVIRLAQRTSDVHVPLVVPPRACAASVAAQAANTADSPLWQECWYSRTPVQAIQHGHVRARHNQHVLWGCFSLPVPAQESCAAAVQQHYLQLFEVLRQTGFTQLWRVWNFVPNINLADAQGMEMYRAFNQGRAMAFARFFDQGEQTMPWATRRMPAATAVGCQGHDINVYFLAGRQAARHIENPRQRPAYKYPTEYGPRPPSFARASAVSLQKQHMLFISGTASIIGHSSVHIADLAGQCRTAVENMQIVAARAGRSLQQLTHFKVYVRHARDVPAVRALFQSMLGVGEEQIICFVADICRQNLLVEIEAMQL